MALSYKARKRWSLFVLLVGFPLYIVLAWGILSRMNLWELPLLVELVVYVFFGVAWIFPLKPIFKGVGQPDPDARD
ncbi:DUF2842 domain-containing protein [Antarctobacter heliothermus]|uniref:DUF2842 domain-containing protein n=1 Tax=Antarctobacter heliothermus TaxID=74033 RepID=A0A239CNQ5_9RHOB|nr:DUF2842 domain-containing protein [Antarctobacter heliothermus]SNS21579.1 Protein of unknown function [Antarctobacter heliothermus]